jgi:hypothetical protein
VAKIVGMDFSKGMAERARHVNTYSKYSQLVWGAAGTVNSIDLVNVMNGQQMIRTIYSGICW